MIQKFVTILGSYSIGSICNNLSSSAHVIWTLNILSEWSFRCRGIDRQLKYFKPAFSP